MKITAVVMSFFVLAGISITQSAMAREVPIKSTKEVKKICGDAYSAPSGKGVYGCIKPDGSGIACGGVTSKDKKTCTTFREAPRRLPTRAEARKADQAELYDVGWPGEEGGRFKESVATQKRINRYFHTVVVPKLKTCWEGVQGKGLIEMKYWFEDDSKAGWAFKTLKGGKSNLPKGQDEVALACMQKAVAETSFPKESDTGASYVINWDWPVPLPPDAAQQVERMVGSGGGEGTGCDGHGASARCVTCSGHPQTCIYVCVGADTCEVATSPPGGFDSICTEGGKCASGGLFGVVGGMVMY